MWLLKELNRENVARMEELGFTFPVDKLYDEQHPSLKDAVVIFGGGLQRCGSIGTGIDIYQPPLRLWSYPKAEFCGT